MFPRETLVVCNARCLRYRLASFDLVIYGPLKQPEDRIVGDNILKDGKVVAKLGTFNGIAVAANLDNEVIGMHIKGRLSNGQLAVVAGFDACSSSSSSCSRIRGWIAWAAPRWWCWCSSCPERAAPPPSG